MIATQKKVRDLHLQMAGIYLGSTDISAKKKSSILYAVIWQETIRIAMQYSEAPEKQEVLVGADLKLHSVRVLLIPTESVFAIIVAEHASSVNKQ